MKSIVITGSTRGIGYGLAAAFLDSCCEVTVSGRSPRGVDTALRGLADAHGDDRLHGHACDVTQLEQVERLWDSAKARFGEVDIWINNAGIGHAMLSMWELPPEELKGVVDANVLGSIYGSRVAIRGMLAQGHGQLYNMLGHGSNGDMRDGMSVYGTTKWAVAYLSKALISETDGTPVQIGTLSPGMVLTDLVMDRLRDNPESLARARRILNIITDRVETVTPWLAQKVLVNDKRRPH